MNVCVCVCTHRKGREFGSNWGCYYFLFGKKIVKYFVHVTYSPSHQQVSAPTINIQSTLHTALELCKDISLEILFGSNSNSYMISTQSDMCVCVCVCVYTHTHTHTHISDCVEIIYELLLLPNNISSEISLHSSRAV